MVSISVQRYFNARKGLSVDGLFYVLIWQLPISFEYLKKRLTFYSQSLKDRSELAFSKCITHTKVVDIITIFGSYLVAQTLIGQGVSAGRNLSFIHVFIHG